MTTTAPITTLPITTLPITTTYTPTPTTTKQPLGVGIPVWRDENTGDEIKDIHDQSTNIYSKAIENELYEYITDGRSLYIHPKTYYYYTGNDSQVIIPHEFNIPNNTPLKPVKANRIYQPYPYPRFLMLTNRSYEGTLNPIITQPVPTQAPYPKITIVSESLNANNNDLYTQRYNIIDTQETINTLTNRLNNLKLKLSSIKQKPLYSAGGSLTFY